MIAVVALIANALHLPQCLALPLRLPQYSILSLEICMALGGFCEVVLDGLGEMHLVQLWLLLEEALVCHWFRCTGAASLAFLCGLVSHRALAFF